LGQLLPQSPEEPFDVGQLATGLSDLLVTGVARKNWEKLSLRRISRNR
jgi:hypothetical protein